VPSLARHEWAERISEFVLGHGLKPTTKFQHTSSPIILGRPFLRTTSVVIDSKEGNVKFQFPHKKCMDHLPRKKVNIHKYKCPRDTSPIEIIRYKS
jgi:hypothetical protein